MHDSSESTVCANTTYKLCVDCYACDFSEFHDLEPDTTMRALQALEALGKCAIVHGDSNDSMVSSPVIGPGYYLCQKIQPLHFSY